MSKRIYLFAALIIALASTGCISQLPQDEIDNRVNTYFEKHADTALGQKTKSFEREFPFTMNDGITNFKNGKAYALYGVINRIQIYQDIDKSVPLAEANARVYNEAAQLAKSFGLDRDYFKRHHVFGIPGRDHYLRDWYKNDGEQSPTPILFLIGFDLKEAHIGKDNCWRYVIELNNFGTNRSNRDL